MRGVLAEYIVASALEIATNTRLDWDAYDMVTPDGVKLEIKSTAYLQTWTQPKLSIIEFDIAPKRGWDASTNKHSGEARRRADIYVFCVLHHQEKSTLDPLDLDQWTFYLLPTSVLNAKKPVQKKIRLGALKKLGPVQTSFGELAPAIKKIIPAENRLA
jgi:hypothetical protein